MTVSIVMGVRGRPKSTRRALMAYTKIDHPDWELLFVDVLHGGTDQKALYDEFKDKLPIRYLSLREDMHNFTRGETTWTPATTWNYGIGQSRGDFVIVTGADILAPDPDLITKFLTQYRNNRLSVLTYFLSDPMTSGLDTWDWMETPKAIQSYGGFWDTPIWNGHPNRDHTSGGITTFMTGQPRTEWDYMGGFREELSHLVNDQDLYLRTLAAGRGIDTLLDTCVYHQSHNEYQISAGRDCCSPGWHYANEAQARLLEPAERDNN